MNILVLDDNAAVLEVLALMLTGDGHTVLTTCGGHEALALLEALREAGDSVDWVLTDLAMPGMSGLDVVHAVRVRWPRIRVGLITGAIHQLPDPHEPVDLLLTKPVNLEDLREAIAGCGDGRARDTVHDLPHLPDWPHRGNP